MSFSNSVPANTNLQHYERIAKSFLEKRRRGDTSSCDLKIKLKNGSYDMVHSNVVCVNSTFLNTMVENQRPPYQPIDLSEFESASVKRTIDWMYSGVFNFPEAELARDLAVASFLQVNLLQNRFEQEIRNIRGQPIKALNIATRGSISTKKNQSFRPWVTMMHVSDETINALAAELSQMVSTMTAEQVDQLEVNSVIAVMAATLPLDTKIPLINLAIQWILNKKADRDVCLSIIESIIISDVTFRTVYNIRYYLNQYLENPKAAGKGLIRMHKDGTMSIFVDPREGKDRIVWTPPVHHQNPELNRKVADWKADYDKKAMDELRSSNLGSFGRSPSISSASGRYVTEFRRETSDGVPKYFTRSEVVNLNDMHDEFVAHPNELVPDPPKRAHIPGFSTMPCTAGYAGFDPARLAANKTRAAAEKAQRARFTASEREENRAMPDPFVLSNVSRSHQARGANKSSSSHSSQSNQSLHSSSGTNQFKAKVGGQAGAEAQGPVLLCPARNSGFGCGSASNSSISGFTHRPYSYQTIQPNLPADTSTRSSSSTTSIRKPLMQGVRKTASEIDEINRLPNLGTVGSSTSTGNLGKKPFPKSDYLYPK